MTRAEQPGTSSKTLETDCSGKARKQKVSVAADHNREPLFAC